MTKPDYARRCGITIPHLADIPEPHLRQFPNDARLRRVFVSISSFDIVGGKHYYVRVREECNPIWDERTYEEAGRKNPRMAKKVMGWREARDDLEGTGREFNSSQLTHRWEVGDFVMETAQKHFPADTHEVLMCLTEKLFDTDRWPTRRMKGKYCYPREGG